MCTTVMCFSQHQALRAAVSQSSNTIIVAPLDNKSYWIYYAKYLLKEQLINNCYIQVSLLTNFCLFLWPFWSKEMGTTTSYNSKMTNIAADTAAKEELPIYHRRNSRRKSYSIRLWDALQVYMSAYLSVLT